MYPKHRVDEVLRLVAEGSNDSRISRETGISRATIRQWRRHGPPRGRQHPSGCPRCDGRELDHAAYAYLLGLYLGDGHIVRHRRTFRLSISQDARYVLLTSLAACAIARVRGSGARVGATARGGRVDVSSYWNHWPCLFPQHGSGKKHERRIRLVGWQQRIVNAYPRQFLRGLIHSDGCRVTNRVGKYAYPRYFFTNSSGDILQIFRDTCDAIGVPHRDPKSNTISVARRDGVAALDAFIGPKW